MSSSSCPLHHRPSARSSSTSSPMGQSVLCCQSIGTLLPFSCSVLVNAPGSTRSAPSSTLLYGDRQPSKEPSAPRVVTAIRNWRCLFFIVRSWGCLVADLDARGGRRALHVLHRRKVDLHKVIVAALNRVLSFERAHFVDGIDAVLQQRRISQHACLKVGAQQRAQIVAEEEPFVFFFGREHTAPQLLFPPGQVGHQREAYKLVSQGLDVCERRLRKIADDGRKH